MKAVMNDAGQKYRTALLETFDMRDITFLKRASWGGIVAETDRLYSTMFHDWDALQKDCNDIEKAVKSLDWSVTPQVKKGEKVTPEAKKVAQVVEAALWKQGTVPPGEYSHNFAQLLGVLCHAIWRGQNVHRIVWKNNGELVYPARFEQLLPQFLQWEMEPGAIDRMLLIPDGEAAQPVPFPKYNYIVALNNSGPDHPLYNATYYSLVAWFAAFKKGLGWFMQFCERFGLPKPVIHYDNPEDKENIIAQLNDQRVINAILLEGDKQVDWAQMPASGQSLPQRELLTMAESACHKAILGQTLTSDVSKSGGSLAQAKVHAGVQADTVMRYAEYVTDIINTQLIPAIVHLNFGRADMPMPELRCKLPQNVANIERVQFWGQVLQIPGMQVIKSDIYDSLGIAMPAEGDEVLQAPTQEQNALQAALQGQQKAEPDKGRKDEVALAARAQEEEPKGIEGWLAPLKKKLLEAKKTGASFEQLKQMMLEARLNTHALAGAMADNIRKGFYGDEGEEELEAAKKRLSNPVPQADGKKCYTENCSWHKGTTREGETQPKIKKQKKSQNRTETVYSDDICRIKKDKDGNHEVVIVAPVSSEEEAEKLLRKTISQSRENKGGQSQGKQNYGFVAPGENVEFFISKKTINETVKNERHIKRSSNKTAHYSASAIIDKLWEASDEGIQRKPKKGDGKDKQIRYVHERYAKMRINNETYTVKITAFEYKNNSENNMLYDIKAQKNGD